MLTFTIYLPKLCNARWGHARSSVLSCSSVPTSSLQSNHSVTPTQC